MKLLLDQGLPRSTATVLRHKQIEAVHVGELGMAAASDESIIDYARQHGYCIVTLDADFQSLLAVSDSDGPSVIRIRLQRQKANDVASLISTVLQRIGHEVEAGSFVTVTSSTIRVRRLPIRKQR